MNVFDYAQSLWNHRPSHTFGVSGANNGTGSDMRVGRVSAWGGANLGRLAVWVHACVRGHTDKSARVIGASLGPGSGRPRAGARGRCAAGVAYQACVRAQCGQPTEVVTSASNA